MARLADYILWHSPAFEFWSYYWLSLAAECAEVWIMVQIALALAGVTPWLRILIGQAIPALAGIGMALALAMAYQAHQPLYVELKALVLSLDQTELYLFLFVAVVGGLFAEWSGGVRGVAVGFALEIGSGSSASWLTSANFANPFMVAHIKSALYITSLVVWMASISARRAVPDCVRFVPIVEGYAQSYIGLMLFGLRRVIDKK
jgi:hypothetical protein